MSSNIQPAQPLRLSESDVKAILLALPIVEGTSADTPGQTLLNRLCCQDARQKLLAGRKDFSQNELRVIAAAVCYAQQFLSGHIPALNIAEPEALRQYLFSYNRLAAYYQPQIDALYK